MGESGILIDWGFGFRVLGVLRRRLRVWKVLSLFVHRIYWGFLGSVFFFFFFFRRFRGWFRGLGVVLGRLGGSGFMIQGLGLCRTHRRLQWI